MARSRSASLSFQQVLRPPKPTKADFLPGKLIPLTSVPYNARIQEKVSIIFFINFGWYSEIFSLRTILLSVKEKNRLLFANNKMLRQVVKYVTHCVAL